MARLCLLARAGLLLTSTLLLIAGFADAVDRSKFRTCGTTGFCAHYRSIAPSDIALPDRLLGAAVAEVLGSDGALRVGSEVTLTCVNDQVIRVRGEKGSKRWEADDILEKMRVTPMTQTERARTYACGPRHFARIVERESWTTIEFHRENTDSSVAYAVLNERGMSYFEAGNDKAAETAKATGGGAEAAKDPNAGRKILDWGEDGKPVYADDEAGEASEDNKASDAEGAEAAATVSPTSSRSAPETFGGFTDPKPSGPTSVGFDLTFRGENAGEVKLHGLPEHASNFTLRSTHGQDSYYTEPYRLYNLDVFEYEIDQSMALYGAVPFLLARSVATSRVSGVFVNNPSETFVDVSATTSAVPASRAETRWMSEAGVLELFFFAGPTFAETMNRYTEITGRPALPALFSIGFHQCRWNYRDQRDVEEVHAKFEELDFPVDVIWLDIEHTDGKRYFTWDKTKFPEPTKMQEDLSKYGRKLVTIVDPHVKRDDAYEVHKQATAKGMYVKDGTNDFEGWCWPGSSSYPDFTSSAVRAWWGDLYKSYYQHVTPDLHIWNDMNEPSVFNGPEVTMKKTTTNVAGVEHREWHNLYGYYYHRATIEGLEQLRPNKRAFALTRAFYAGTQKLGAIWTGDNAADWQHMKASVPMLLSLGVGGQNFVGADVGGFFGNPSEELMVRWFQAGAFQPFFRAHAHIDTKRREPWLFGEAALEQLRDAVVARYRLLPYIYTAFAEAARSGLPVMRPVWMNVETETDPAATGALDAGEDEGWLLGRDLFVRPVVQAGAAATSIHLPKGSAWFPVGTASAPAGGALSYAFGAINGATSFRGDISVKSPRHRLPLFQRAGSIIPRRMRVRRSSSLMKRDPYTLFVALNEKSEADGELYLDDFESIATPAIRVAWRVGATPAGLKFVGAVADRRDVSGAARGVAEAGSGAAMGEECLIERVLVYGLPPSRLATLCAAKTAKATQAGRALSIDVECSAADAAANFWGDNVLILRKPGLRVGEAFEVDLSEA